MNREQIVEQRRQQGEMAYRQKFESFGLSEHFEFVRRGWGDHKGQATVKCKNCGNVFDTWNVREYFRGKVKNICCHECGMKSDGTYQWTKTSARKEAINYYLQGHTVKEVAEKYGITVTQFENERRERGILKPPGQRKDSWRASLKKAGEKANLNAVARADHKRVEHLESLGFDFIKKSEGKGTVKCRECGHVFERSLPHLTGGNVECPECKRRVRESREVERQAEKEKNRRKLESERTAKTPMGLTPYQLEREKKLDVVHICKECGKEYTPREYIRQTGGKSYSNPGFCSKICQKKYNHKKRPDWNKGHRRRARHYGCEYDPSVTLPKLIKRDGLRCAICGGICDPKDHTWSRYFGPKSPTIDHIIPLAKGGGHTWDNVQVAHAICNSTKGDNVNEGKAHNAS